MFRYWQWRDSGKINFGDWEGWSLDEARERNPEKYAEWKSGAADFRFPGGDSKIDFFKKKAAAARVVFSDFEGPGLAVLHKGVIRGVLLGLLDLPPEEVAMLKIELGGIFRLAKEAGGWKLLSANETAHLGDMRIPESG